MKLSRSATGCIVLAGSALGQTSKKYCDASTSICYSGYSPGNGVTVGVALPETNVAPFDTVLQIVSPIKNGWVGFSWGGTMPYVPLTVAWVNNASNTVIYSSRMAFGLSLPQPYADAEYSYLKGTGYNTTHWTLNVRCKGCSQWQDTEGKTVSLDTTNPALPFAHGLASKLPKEPANNRSTFNVHSSFGHWSLDLSQGKNANFDKLVANALIPDSTKTPLPSSTPTPTTTQSSTLTTSVIPTTTPGPIQSGMPTSCAGVRDFHSPVLTAKGWKAVKVASDLTQPRGIIFDSAGNLLVVQNGLGITAHTIDSNGCLSSQTTVISQRNLNHGIVLSHDGKTLYASSATQVFAWSYDATTKSVGALSRIVIGGMDSKGHVTRTLVIPPKHPDLLVVSHGSNDNFDYDAGNMATGRSCVKVFDTTSIPLHGHDYPTGGYQLGYGLRNGVGLAFDASGMLWEVENSSDELHRTAPNGTSIDIHTDNPAEELNYLGDPAVPNTQWYGYPTCYTIWSPAALNTPTAPTRFALGDQFVLAPNTTFTDATCASRSTAPRLAFAAHSAPLDAAFSKDYSSLFVTFHGSWNRVPATGYKIVEVPFGTDARGAFGPKSGIKESGTGYREILWSADEGGCSTTQCFRPVSIAKDGFERMYVSSDSGAEGEILLLGRV